MIFQSCAQQKLQSCTDICLATERELFSILLRLDQLEGFEIDFMVIGTLDVISAKIKIIVINHQDDHQSWKVVYFIADLAVWLLFWSEKIKALFLLKVSFKQTNSLGKSLQ